MTKEVTLEFILSPPTITARSNARYGWTTTETREIAKFLIIDFIIRFFSISIFQGVIFFFSADDGRPPRGFYNNL